MTPIDLARCGPEREDHMRFSALMLPAILSVASSGCATHGYVMRQVGEVNVKVDELSSQLETTQERLRRNEARIGEIDQHAQEGVRDARGAAEQAMSKASSAEVLARGKLLYTVTLSDDTVKFPLDHAELGDAARQAIDEAVEPLKRENRGVYLEIEGHTDSSGPSDYNRALGEQRATAVRDYLHDQLGIALSRMQVISYGAASPIVDNSTPEHRAENRRVVIKVLE